MRKISAVILMVIVGATMAMANEIAFIDGYDSALKIAAAKNQNILITFWSDT